ncbi:MAG: glycerophosphodiester phosphodiesterase family protein [Pyrinomonadaceae bacterium]
MRDSNPRRTLSLQQPLIIAHRGASSVAPENTMAAFERALADGADGIEFDVRLAGDGVPVVIHDAELRRVGRRPGNVSSLTSAELGECEVGSWFNHRFPALAQKSYASERVPTLKQLFRFIAGSEARLYLEMKAGKGDGSSLPLEVSKLIRDHSLEARVVVLSFDLTSIRDLKMIDSNIRTGALFQPGLFRIGASVRKTRMVRAAMEVEANQIALHRLLVSPRIVRQARDEGLDVVVWTVDQPAWVETARQLGVQALITNNPRAMRSGADSL